MFSKKRGWGEKIVFFDVLNSPVSHISHLPLPFTGNCVDLQQVKFPLMRNISLPRNLHSLHPPPPPKQALVCQQPQTPHLFPVAASICFSPRELLVPAQISQIKHNCETPN